MRTLKRWTEYGIRTIDEFGDVIDVDYRDRKAAAFAAARKLLVGDGVYAVVVERERKSAYVDDYGNVEDLQVEYETVAAVGDEAACDRWKDGGGA